MKKVYFGTLILLSSACGFLASCSNDTVTSSASTAGSSNTGVLDASTPTGIITHRDFSINFDPGSANVFTTTKGFDGGVEVAVTVSASDIHDLLVEGQTVKFRTEWGTFPEGDTCVLTDGHCSIKWLPGDAYTAPSALFPSATPPESAECQVAFTAWTIGEEKFADANDNGLFDAGETFLDLPEPYLDINESGLWTNVSTGYVTGWDGAGFCNSDGVCELIDVDNNGVHTVGDGKYNGSLCASNNSAQCSSNTSTVIWTTSYLYISDPQNPTTCDMFKPSAP
jgi:hypothetical protein